MKRKFRFHGVIKNTNLEFYTKWYDLEEITIEKMNQYKKWVDDVSSTWSVEFDNLKEGE